MIVTTRIPLSLIVSCKDKLLKTKSDLINRMAENRLDYFSRDKGSDEGDQSMAALAETDFLSSQDRLRKQILEVELALSRIERGTFGICEETEEIIEPERLQAIPWTRLSIEGAEIQDTLNRRYAKKSGY